MGVCTGAHVPATLLFRSAASTGLCARAGTSTSTAAKACSPTITAAATRQSARCTAPSTLTAAAAAICTTTAAAATASAHSAAPCSQVPFPFQDPLRLKGLVKHVACVALPCNLQKYLAHSCRHPHCSISSSSSRACHSAQTPSIGCD